MPAARVEAIEHDVAVARYTAVVGRPSRPSPEINSKIIAVNFNPFWTVPVSIVRKDLIPLMEKEPDYLTRNHIRIYDVHHNELQPSQIDWYSEDAVHYTFRQDPGDFNSLGHLRINFPSAYGVYMHDTPEKDLFGEDMRYNSSGCCRVQNVRELVYWLLDGTKGWQPEAIDQAVQSGESGQCAAGETGAAALGLRHGVVGFRWHRAIPRRHLWPGRSRRAGAAADDQALAGSTYVPRPHLAQAAASYLTETSQLSAQV